MSKTFFLRIENSFDMRYYRVDNGERLVARNDDGLYNLTAAKPRLRTFPELASAADIAGRSIDDVASDLLENAETVEIRNLDRAADRPVVPDEVWAAGVTYEISEQARESESGMPEVYLDVYDGERSEIFFKATPSRTVGPDESIGIRADSDWNVPEPELAVVLYGGEIVGFTIGNDVSSRAIEGENPLYLPQAKVYDKCCSIGPCVASAASVDDPHDLEISMEIERGSKVVFEGTTSTAEMVRTCEELVNYHKRHNAVPELAVLLTGTSLVPPDGFTLQAGDAVRITIENVGTLENAVETV